MSPPNSGPRVAGGRANEAGPKRGAPPKTDGLNELDQDRSASLADEGGVSAATVESQEEGENHWGSRAREGEGNKKSER